MTEVLAELGVHLDLAVAKHADRIVSAVERGSTSRPVHRRTVAAAAWPAAGTGVALLASVPAGRAYNVLGFVVVGPDPFTAPAAAALAIGAAETDPAAGTARMPDVASPAVTTAYYFAPGTVWARHGEDIYALLKGGVAGTGTVVLLYDDWAAELQGPSGL